MAMVDVDGGSQFPADSAQVGWSEGCIHPVLVVIIIMSSALSAIPLERPLGV